MWRRRIHNCLPTGAASPNNSSAWIISAPEIERAIRRLCAELGRSPTDIELAAKLNISLSFYQQALSHLKDLEIGMLRVEPPSDSGEEWMAYLPDGAEGDVLFRCLRFEMQGVFANAIRNLPRMEKLVISFYYPKCIYDRSISVILELPESAITNIRTSAYLHIRASLPNPHLQVRPRVRGLLSAPSNESSPGGNNETAKVRNSDNADVTVCGSQSGSLQTGQPWEFVDGQAKWNRDFRSWYSLDVDHNLNQIRREEHYQLKLEM
jgi:hypothetical protein